MTLREWQRMTMTQRLALNWAPGHKELWLRGYQEARGHFDSGRWTYASLGSFCFDVKGYEGRIGENSRDELMYMPSTVIRDRLMGVGDRRLFIKGRRVKL